MAGIRAVISGKGLNYIVASVMTVALVALRVWDPAPLQILRLKAFDLYQQAQPRKVDPKQPRPVYIIDLDEASLAAYGQWPWPRTRVAKLVENLTRYKVAAIGFDIFFVEPDRTSPGLIADSLVGIDAETRDKLRKLPSNDTMLAAVLKRSPTVLGQATLSTGEPVTTERKSIKTSVGIKGVKGVNLKHYAFSFASLVRNIVELEDVARGIGVVTIKPEIDGAVRRVPLVTRVGNQLYPALSLEMLRVALGRRSVLVVGDQAGMTEVKLTKEFSIPTDANGRTWVNFAPFSPDRYISAKDVLDETVPPERLAGKLVVIGTSAAGLLDIKTTPLHDALPGVEVHAQLIEMVFADVRRKQLEKALAQVMKLPGEKRDPAQVAQLTSLLEAAEALGPAYLFRPNYTLGAELALLLGICVVLTIMVTLAGAVWGLFAGGAVTSALFATSWYLYVDQGVLLGVAYIAFAGFALYSIITYLKYVREEAERRKTRDQFQHYLSPDLVQRLAEHPEDLHLGGEMKDMTLLFCDIRGFTSISELYKKDPTGLTSLINRFLTPMTDLILARHGTIDKYMGDCIMAFWNAPLEDPDHPRNACRSALEMMVGVKELNVDLRAEAEAKGKPYIPIKIGIGLNTGECCVGNMGSEQRFDYSVLGDDVNLASRLEGQSKTYGVDIIIGENTRKRAADLAALELDLIKVKGKEEAVRIHVLLGDAEISESAEFIAFSARHDEMLAAYRGQQWDAARALAAECRKLNGHLDGLYDLYDERIDAYQADPPGPDWDGVFVATTK